jgi:hypothetical protein
MIRWGVGGSVDFSAKIFRLEKRCDPEGPKSWRVLGSGFLIVQADSNQLDLLIRLGTDFKRKGGFGISVRAFPSEGLSGFAKHALRAEGPLGCIEETGAAAELDRFGGVTFDSNDIDKGLRAALSHENTEVLDRAISKFTASRHIARKFVRFVRLDFHGFGGFRLIEAMDKVHARALDHDQYVDWLAA